MQSIGRRLDLPHRAEAKNFIIRRPEELFVVSRINQLLLDVANGALNVTNKLPSVTTLQFANLCFVIKDWVLKDLFDILVANLWWVLTR